VDHCFSAAAHPIIAHKLWKKHPFADGDAYRMVRQMLL